MCSVDEGVAVDVVYLDISKAFNTVSHSFLPEKLAAQGLGACMLTVAYRMFMGNPVLNHSWTT